MKKTVKYNGENIKVEFEKRLNSKSFFLESIKENSGKMVGLIGYDFVINGFIFKIVEEVYTNFVSTRNYLGMKNTGRYTVPEHLSGDYTENDKAVIEALIDKYPQLVK